jgi:hypothetical protein
MSSFRAGESGLPNCTGTRPIVEVKRKSSVSDTSTDEERFAVCVDNSGYEASLELHKIYLVKADADAAKEGPFAATVDARDLRIVDESGEDYLFEAKRFVPIELPKMLERSVLRKASYP